MEGAYRAEISGFLHPGRNQLVIRVANDWANRLIGDALESQGRHYAKTNIVRTTVDGRPWEKVEPLRSGLFGPVVLRTGELLKTLE